MRFWRAVKRVRDAVEANGGSLPALEGHPLTGYRSRSNTWAVARAVGLKSVRQGKHFVWEPMRKLTPGEVKLCEVAERAPEGEDGTGG